MKLLIALCFVALVGLSLARDLYPRGCIYVNGRCPGSFCSSCRSVSDRWMDLGVPVGQRQCEVGTHAYTTGCGFITPEATCDNPNPVLDTRGMICDFTDCYCDSPTVRDTTTKKCVPLEECPKKEVEKK